MGGWGAGEAPSLRASSPIWASEASLARTRERAAKKRGQRKARSREARFVRPNRRACSQARKPLCSRVLARLVSLAHMGELAPRLC